MVWRLVCAEMAVQCAMAVTDWWWWLRGDRATEKGFIHRGGSRDVSRLWLHEATISITLHCTVFCIFLVYDSKVGDTSAIVFLMEQTEHHHALESQVHEPGSLFQIQVKPVANHISNPN